MIKMLLFSVKGDVVNIETVIMNLTVQTRWNWLCKQHNNGLAMFPVAVP